MREWSLQTCQKLSFNIPASYYWWSSSHHLYFVSSVASLKKGTITNLKTRSLVIYKFKREHTKRNHIHCSFSNVFTYSIIWVNPLCFLRLQAVSVNKFYASKLLSWNSKEVQDYSKWLSGYKCPAAIPHQIRETTTIWQFHSKVVCTVSRDRVPVYTGSEGTNQNHH